MMASMRMERNRINVAILAVVAVVALGAWRPSAEESQGAESILLDSSPGGWRRSPAVFVFGASYMDVGARTSPQCRFGRTQTFAPYGMDFFRTPTDRHSNGRLIIDHIEWLLVTLEAFARGVYIIESGSNNYIPLRSDQYEAMTPLVLKHIEHAVWMLDAHKFYSLVGAIVGVIVGATVITFSIHGVFMSAIRNPSKFGLKYINKACCGYGDGEYNSNKAVHCGRDGIVDGKLRKATVCENRSEYMMWDNVHPTEAFAFRIAQAFLNTEHMQPPFSVKEMCMHEQ